MIQQIYLIVIGQTWHEYGKRISIYNQRQRLRANIEVVFGKHWQFVFFSPMVSSAPVGDGMSFDVISK
jgi:hypothetical protein